MTHPDTLSAILARHPGLLFDLKCLPFRERATLAEELVLTLACCTGCGCYIGAPYCHPPEDAHDQCVGRDDDAHGEVA